MPLPIKLNNIEKIIILGTNTSIYVKLYIGIIISPLFEFVEEQRK